MKRRWIDTDELTITVPGRENNDGTTTDAVDFRCKVETLSTGPKRIRECVEVKR